MTAAAGTASQGQPHCLNWRFGGPRGRHAPDCGRWGCPLHGWEARRERAERLRLWLPDGPTWTNVLWPNRRLDAKGLEAVWGRLHYFARKLLPGRPMLGFPHFESDRARLPIVHLHLLVCQGTTEDREQNRELDVLLRCALQRNGLALSFLGKPPPAPDLPDAKAKDWIALPDPGSHLGYLCRARSEDRAKPPEELPPPRQGYRQVYGLPRF